MKPTIPAWVYWASIALLGIALLDLPYGYYQFLRIAIAAISIWIAAQFHSTGNTIGLITFGVIAVLYNPILKIHMERETHEVVNVVTAVLFAAAWLFQSKRARGGPDG